VGGYTDVIAGPLIAAYQLVFGVPPEGLTAWQVADMLLEALDDSEMVPNELARVCIYEITNGLINWPDDATRIEIVSAAERLARVVFTELANIDEVHMNQIAFFHFQALYA